MCHCNIQLSKDYHGQEKLMKPEKKLTDQLFIALGYALAIFVFVKNMWMSDDAYIMFRTIEQIFAGNGAVWNLGERVQVYTSVLWFWIIVFIPHIIIRSIHHNQCRFFHFLYAYSVSRKENAEVISIFPFRSFSNDFEYWLL
jgi:hypothetical protein